jgi:hypothetical protein
MQKTNQSRGRFGIHRFSILLAPIKNLDPHLGAAACLRRTNPNTGIYIGFDKWIFSTNK